MPDFEVKYEARVNLHLNLLDLLSIFVMLSNILLVAELFVVVEPCGVFCNLIIRHLHRLVLRSNEVVWVDGTAAAVATVHDAAIVCVPK